MVDLTKITQVKVLYDSLVLDFADHINQFLDQGWVLLTCDGPNEMHSVYSAILGLVVK